MLHIHFLSCGGHYSTALSSLAGTPLDCNRRNERRRACGAPTLGAGLEVGTTHNSQIKGDVALLVTRRLRAIGGWYVGAPDWEKTINVCQHICSQCS